MQQSRRDTAQSRKRQPPPLTAPSAESASPDPEAVAHRAYRRFEARGYEHGRDMDDWLEAEREVRESRLSKRGAERSDRSREGSTEAA